MSAYFLRIFHSFWDFGNCLGVIGFSASCEALLPRVEIISFAKLMLFRWMDEYIEYKLKYLLNLIK